MKYEQNNNEPLTTYSDFSIFVNNRYKNLHIFLWTPNVPIMCWFKIKINSLRLTKTLQLSSIDVTIRDTMCCYLKVIIILFSNLSTIIVCIR